MALQGEGDAVRTGGDASRALSRDDLDERLRAVEAAVEDIRRRQVVAELRSDPGRLLAGVAGSRRLVRQDLDDLADLLGRWDVPLSASDICELRRAALVAQGVSAALHSTVHLVVCVSSSALLADLEGVARAARVLSSRSRRTIPVLVTLRAPTHELTTAALDLGVELVIDA